MTSPRTDRRPTASFVLAALLLIAGVVPLPAGALRDARQAVQSLEPNRADRDASAGSYYEGLINVGAGGTRNELALRLLGKPSGWVSFHDVDATRYLAGDLLQFELRPGLRRTVMGRPFTTDREGLRDREYAREKPPGTFRIALLGASMDMGWGVATDETYENRLEDWLNAYARRCGIARRFEVLNFSMAAYSPLHRLEAFRRKAGAYRPDLVLYSATLLDPRLLEIHLCGLLQDEVDSGPYAFLDRALADAGVVPGKIPRDSAGQLADKDGLKHRLRRELWPIIDATLGFLAGECRSRGLPLWCVAIPRAGDSDLPASRRPDVGRYARISARHDIPFVDLSATFDDEDPAEVEIAAWDDHPNARGHKLLFQALAERIIADARLYRDVFGAGVPAPARPGIGDPGR
jgi:hypothetical protein